MSIFKEIELTEEQLSQVVGGCHRHEEWREDRDEDRDEEFEGRRRFHFSHREHRSSALSLEVLGERDEETRGIF
jgi:bacteriocin-like protein